MTVLEQFSDQEKEDMAEDGVIEASGGVTLICGKAPPGVAAGGNWARAESTGSHATMTQAATNAVTTGSNWPTRKSRKRRMPFCSRKPSFNSIKANTNRRWPH